MFKPTGDKIDVFWKWNSLKYKNNKKSVTCDFCHQTSTEGISRARRHQLQIKGDVGSCKKVPEDLKLQHTWRQRKKKTTKMKMGSKRLQDLKVEKGLQQHQMKPPQLLPRRGPQIKKGPLDFLFSKEPEAIGTYGPHLKPPSYHELRVPLLKKELEYTKGLLRGHEEERIKYGCLIITLINFLVNCSLGTQFVKSVDASEYMKTSQKIFELLDSFVEEIGEKNVIQVVTDNGSNYVLAGKILQVTRPKIFWTPCATHCFDLMLEDIGKIPKVKRVIQRGIKLVGYIYNHTFALNIMRKFTQKTELVRHGVTRFATTFLTLQRLHKQKANLRRMFTLDEWLKSKAAKEPKGKKATYVVLMPSFWNDVVYTLKAMGPLVNCQLHHPLHAVGYYLNPKFFYTNPNIDNDNEMVDDLYICIDRLSEDDDFVVEVHKQLLVYKRAGERFGMTVTMKARTEISPKKTPHLQTIVIKVLNLTCSSSGCELIGIHSKKRSRLEHQKLQDLVYVKYNQALLDRFECHDVIDPITLNDIDYSNEWLLGELEGEEADNDLVFDDDDDLNWLDVA
ncbi:hypothetical protein JHK82_027399 [Glycine max]|nr:hypothetical protein JHK86_027525 [Glycine max]KAG5126564.1 hypothetical protein JHK82_027399 [Glycine max]KAG5151174.1 hypothetical protein JHK84_027646 [Glycine max]